MNLECDFCSSPDVQWSYPARDHVSHLGREYGLDFQLGSTGGWTACPACHALIERGDRRRLATRSLRRLIRKEPGVAAHKAEMLAALRQIHDDFWQNREGPPARVPRA